MNTIYHHFFVRISMLLQTAFDRLEYNQQKMDLINVDQLQQLLHEAGDF
jgi:hypothetical protein